MRVILLETLQSAQEKAEELEDEAEREATMEETLKSISGMSLDELQTYAKAESVNTDTFAVVTCIVVLAM